jgi:hypothetical protein
MKFNCAASVAVLAIVAAHASEENDSSSGEVEVAAGMPTWDTFMHNRLFDLRARCEEMEEADDENIPWTCDRFYLHEDAYPGLQVRSVWALSFSQPNALVGWLVD